jgi:hypothetical protein
MEIGVSMKNKLLIGVGLGLIVGLTFLGLTVGIKNKNIVEETTEVASDYSISETSETEVYATRFTGYRLVDNIGISKAAYDSIDKALRDSGLATEEITINKSTYDKNTGIFRYKSVEVDCSKYLDLHEFEIVNSGNIPEDVVKKVKSWLSSIDALGEVELISYDADSGDLQFTINGESKTATIK